MNGKEDKEDKVDKQGLRTQYHFHISSHLAVDRNVKDYYNIARKFA